ncbi:hypothetical protein EDC96DRAFT_566767 [Choanephora cucurbitarum]|nr:hypothetical protein EDC96DRAFT_566767 [Choanephora cucurbitarum]
MCFYPSLHVCIGELGDDAVEQKGNSLFNYQCNSPKMNDSVSILVAVFLILIVLRWMLGGNPQQQQPSGTRRTVNRRMHRVTPQMIEQVRAMFPDIPTAAIQADLQRTGSVETTVDNALRDGSLPLPPSSTTNSPTMNTSTSSSSTNARSSPSHPNLVQRYKIDVQKEKELEQEPPKVWEASPDKRQEMLKKRKEFMVLQARKKLMEQQQKKQQADDAEKTFDDMSVEELNSLSAEQRRDQMLKALERRTSS